MKIFFFVTFYLLTLGTVHGLENCKKINNIEGKYYWFNSIVFGTSIIDDGKDIRIWYINSDPTRCYKSTQNEINNPGTIYISHIMALRKLGNDFNSENRIKITKITGISFKDSKQFNNWFSMNSNKFFWSFEKNKIIVLENGFRCKEITPAGGKLYWFNFSLGAVKDMDTSSDKRLWRDNEDSTKCFISPLKEINDQKIQTQGFKLALMHVGSKNDVMRRQIINRFKRLTNDNKLLFNKLTNTN